MVYLGEYFLTDQLNYLVIISRFLQNFLNSSRINENCGYEHFYRSCLIAHLYGATLWALSVDSYDTFYVFECNKLHSLNVSALPVFVNFVPLETIDN